MYFSYDDFTSVTLGGIDEPTYERLAPMADLVIDHWTLGRVGKAYEAYDELPASVLTLYAAIVEALPGAMSDSKASGGLVTSFSNGVDSYSFDVSETVQTRLRRQLGWMLGLLPVEWCSAVVPFEGGAAYAG